MKRGPKTSELPTDTTRAAAAISAQRRQKSRSAGLERCAQHEPDADQQQELRHDRSPPAEPGLVGQHAKLHPTEVVQVIDEVERDHLRDRKAAQNVDDGQAGGGLRHRARLVASMLPCAPAAPSCELLWSVQAGEATGSPKF